MGAVVLLEQATSIVSVSANDLPGM